MTPRCLTTGSIRHVPGEPPAQRKHGPITGLVHRSDGAYEGTCDGEAVCVAEISQGHWRARTRDAVLAEGSLVEVLGIRVGDTWLSPTEFRWTVDGILGGDTLHLSHRAQQCRTGYGTAAELLADGWRPEGERR